MFLDNYNTDYNYISKQLRLDENKRVVTSISNIETIFRLDQNLNGLFGIDERTGSLVLMKNPPWKTNKREIENIFDIRNDISIIHSYLRYFYKFNSKSTLKDFIISVSTQQYTHPIREYLGHLMWDGQKRLETLFIDYLAADDNWFIRSVTKKTLIGAVGKIYNPGLNHDTTIILSGKQGCGKSLILKKLGGKWFNDSIESFKGEETYFKMAKSWIIEMSELTAYKNSGMERLKQVLTSTTDTYRDKYAGESKGHIRDCIFFGTTNEETFLTDETGNRRFIPIKVGHCNKNIYSIHDLTQEVIDQIWAEAKCYYFRGETNNLSEDEKLFLEIHQEKFKAIDELEEEIAKYIAKKIPSNWDEMSLEDKRNFIKEYDQKDDESKFLYDRSKISAREIREVLLKD